MDSHRKNVTQLNTTLRRRTAELAVTKRQLGRDVVRRKRVEADLKKSAADHNRLLGKSLQLQEELRTLARRVLTAQEKERKKISLGLRNEVAQTLLGIHVRLLLLKKEARHNTKGLKDEIAGTQRLVAQSARSMRRVTRGLNIVPGM